MKQDVVKFLANQPKNDSEKFNKAVSLYRQSKGSDPSLVRFMNSMGFSKDRLDNVLYELKKLHSVTDLEIAKARPKKKKVIQMNPEHEEIKSELKEFDVESAEYGALKSMAAKVSKLIKKEPDDQKGDTLKPFIQDAQNEFFPTEPENDIDSVDKDQKDAKQELEKVKQENEKQLQDKLSAKDLDVNDAREITGDKEAFEKSDKTVPDAVENKPTDTPDASTPLSVTKKDATAEVQAEDLGTEETEKKLLDHVEANQIEVNDDDEVSGEATSEDSRATEDTSGTLSVTSEASEEFKKKLADFDVDAEKYNSVKSFAADVSDVIKEDPKNQKGATLKAFILDAKKKFVVS